MKDFEFARSSRGGIHGWPTPDQAVLTLNELLVSLGGVWAKSEHRPRPTETILSKWDEFLQRWIDSSDLPLILRDGGRLNDQVQSAGGRDVVFGDNMPANWAFGMALRGQVPDLAEWTADMIHKTVPMSFLNRNGWKGDLNVAGWKVCHIEPVSDRKRYKVETAAEGDLRQKFRRFMSPRNIFLVPKIIAGAGELPQMIEAIEDFENRKGENDSEWCF